MLAEQAALHKLEALEAAKKEEQSLKTDPPTEEPAPKVDDSLPHTSAAQAIAAPKRSNSLEFFKSAFESPSPQRAAASDSQDGLANALKNSNTIDRDPSAAASVRPSFKVTTGTSTSPQPPSSPVKRTVMPPPPERYETYLASRPNLRQLMEGKSWVEPAEVDELEVDYEDGLGDDVERETEESELGGLYNLEVNENGMSFGVRRRRFEEEEDEEQNDLDGSEVDDDGDEDESEEGDIERELDDGDFTDPQTKMLFNQVKDPIYRGAANVISQHESEPYFLLQLFRSVEKLDTPYLRQKFLISLDSLMQERDDLLKEETIQQRKRGAAVKRGRRNAIDLGYQRGRRGAVDYGSMKPLPQTDVGEFSNFGKSSPDTDNGLKVPKRFKSGSLEKTKDARASKKASAPVDIETRDTQIEPPHLHSNRPFPMRIADYIVYITEDPDYESELFTDEQINNLKSFLLSLVHSQIDTAGMEVEESFDGETNINTADGSSALAAFRFHQQRNKARSPGATSHDGLDSDIAARILDDMKPMLDLKLDRYVGLHVSTTRRALLNESLEIVRDALAASSKVAAALDGDSSGVPESVETPFKPSVDERDWRSDVSVAGSSKFSRSSSAAPSEVSAHSWTAPGLVGTSQRKLARSVETPARRSVSLHSSPEPRMYGEVKVRGNSYSSSMGHLSTSFRSVDSTESLKHRSADVKLPEPRSMRLPLVSGAKKPHWDGSSSRYAAYDDPLISRNLFEFEESLEDPGASLGLSGNVDPRRRAEALQTLLNSLAEDEEGLFTVCFNSL
jgi:hypothetical protein